MFNLDCLYVQMDLDTVAVFLSSSCHNPLIFIKIITCVRWWNQIYNHARGSRLKVILVFVFLTCLSASLSCSQVNYRRAECPGLSHSTAAVSNHASGMADQLDELLKGNVLHCSEVGVLLDALFPHHTHHLLTTCLCGRGQSRDINTFIYSTSDILPKFKSTLN